MFDVTRDIIAKPTIFRVFPLREGLVPVVDSDLERWLHPRRVGVSQADNSFREARVVNSFQISKKAGRRVVQRRCCSDNLHPVCAIHHSLEFRDIAVCELSCDNLHKGSPLFGKTGAKNSSVVRIADWRETFWRSDDLIVRKDLI